MQIPSPAELLGVFGLDAPQFAVLRQADPIPEPHRTLLAHRDHMTVAMESHHGVEVGVDVLQVHEQGSRYTREILLRRQSDQAVVQYGIARLNLDCFPDLVRSQVLSCNVPLGRILILNDLFRQVELGSQWEVKTGPDFRSRCETAESITYGRTALIHLNEVPTIELLEIVVAGVA